MRLGGYAQAMDDWSGSSLMLILMLVLFGAIAWADWRDGYCLWDRITVPQWKQVGYIDETDNTR
jgi:hypothetical protein